EGGGSCEVGPAGVIGIKRERPALRGGRYGTAAERGNWGRGRVTNRRGARLPASTLSRLSCLRCKSRGRLSWPVNPRRQSSAFNFCSLLKSVALCPPIATRHGLVGLTSTGASSSKQYP